MEISASLIAMIAATGGILHSMERNVLVREPLMALCTCRWVLTGERTHTAHATSKESARSSTRGRYAWDSGWVNVLYENLVTRTRVGTQCPGCTWKKYLLRRPKIKDHAGRPPSYYFFKGCFKVVNEKGLSKSKKRVLYIKISMVVEVADKQTEVNKGNR